MALSLDSFAANLGCDHSSKIRAIPGTTRRRQWSSGFRQKLVGVEDGDVVLRLGETAEILHQRLRLLPSRLAGIADAVRLCVCRHQQWSGCLDLLQLDLGL